MCELIYFVQLGSMHSIWQLSALLYNSLLSVLPYKESAGNMYIEWADNSLLGYLHTDIYQLYQFSRYALLLIATARTSIDGQSWIEIIS